MSEKKHKGNLGENIVIEYLQCQGFHIEAKNYRTRSGEIDIIARKKNLIVFVEVKLRTKAYFTLSQVITPDKQRKIITTALYYCTQNNLFNDNILRFDVGLLEGTQESYALTYIEDAFQTDKGW